MIATTLSQLVRSLRDELANLYDAESLTHECEDVWGVDPEHCWGCAAVEVRQVVRNDLHRTVFDHLEGIHPLDRTALYVGRHRA